MEALLKALFHEDFVRVVVFSARLITTSGSPVIGQFGLFSVGVSPAAVWMPPPWGKDSDLGKARFLSEMTTNVMCLCLRCCVFAEIRRLRILGSRRLEDRYDI